MAAVSLSFLFPLALFSGFPNAASAMEYSTEDMLHYSEAFYTDYTDETPTRDGDTLWNGIAANKWPDSLTPFKDRMVPGRSYVVLYKKLPVRPIDMRSPNRFKNSMAVNEILSKTSIGHMTVGWSCASGDGAEPPSSRSEGLTGSTGENSEQSEIMFRQGWGLTSALATFTDGYLQNGLEVQRYFSTELIDHIDAGAKVPPFVPMVIQVPHAECFAVRDFVDAYLHHPNRPARRFGMLPDPLAFEGAGCGSFAVSALSKSDTWRPLTQTAWRVFRVPKKLLGRLTADELPKDVELPFFTRSSNERVAIKLPSLFLKNWDSGKTAVKIHFVDPELAIFAVRLWLEMAAKENGETPYQRSHINRLKRVYYFNKPAEGLQNYGRESDKDSGVQEINAGFDPGFSAVARAMKAMRSTLSQRGLRPKLVNYPFGVGVMIDQAPLDLAATANRH